MPEARDRLVRPVDLDVIFARSRPGALRVFQDEQENSSIPPALPLGRVGDVTPPGQTTVAGRGSGFGTPRGGFQTPRGGFGRGRRNVTSTTRGTMGRENRPIGSARRGRSVLPAWYPRRPLRDITSIVRAIERRRARLGEVEGLQMESPMPPVNSSVPLSGAQLEHDISLASPNPTAGLKHCPPSVGKVPKILLDITNEAGGESGFLTPEKKLLNSIDKVEKAVMEELNKLKRTPIAKKEERDKRVRTLMSMR